MTVQGMDGLPAKAAYRAVKDHKIVQSSQVCRAS